MIKKEFIDEYQNHLEGVSKEKCAEYIDAFIETLTDIMVDGKDINFVNFGRFGSRIRAERNGFNPKTQEQIVIPKIKVPTFKASSALKEIVKGQK